MSPPSRDSSWAPDPPGQALGSRSAARRRASLSPLQHDQWSAYRAGTYRHRARIRQRPDHEGEQGQGSGATHRRVHPTLAVPLICAALAIAEHGRPASPAVLAADAGDRISHDVDPHDVLLAKVPGDADLQRPVGWRGDAGRSGAPVEQQPCVAGEHSRSMPSSSPDDVPPAQQPVRLDDRRRDGEASGEDRAERVLVQPQLGLLGTGGRRHHRSTAGGTFFPAPDPGDRHRPQTLERERHHRRQLGARLVPLVGQGGADARRQVDGSHEDRGDQNKRTQLACRYRSVCEAPQLSDSSAAPEQGRWTGERARAQPRGLKASAVGTRAVEASLALHLSVASWSPSGAPTASPGPTGQGVPRWTVGGLHPMPPLRPVPRRLVLTSVPHRDAAQRLSLAFSLLARALEEQAPSTTDGRATEHPAAPPRTPSPIEVRP